MSDTRKQCQYAFIKELQRRIEYFRLEYDMTLTDFVGCLDIVKHTLIDNVLAEDDDKDDEEEKG